ncbi:MAG TPA: AzlD family protein [Geminicoccus sp.]|jgi:uncharacterized membrane protein|uniref:AzlD family protein n=1 Tax=Geminicoccus sp. TaxID=2024832 RepID=UPI002E3116B2|nr:AzlD family protein [Geminicoccus sp.]HEX2527993.1 AzlD family protein [Geminicoccus sp.]
MIPAVDLVTILLMALATYATRVGGYVLLRDRTLGPRAEAVMKAAPGCVLLAVIAPYFVAPRLADLIALGVTILAAARLPMLAVVVTAVASAGLLRHALG